MIRTGGRRKALLGSAVFVSLTFALFLGTRKRQQSDVELVKPIPQPSPGSNFGNLVDSRTRLKQLWGNGLEEKYELLFTYSELISYGTDSPLLPRPRCSDGVDKSVLMNYSSLSRFQKKTAEVSDIVKLVTAQSRGFYVAALLRNSCELASHFALEIIKLVLILGANNRTRVFVSVLESGSTDCSKQVISLLNDILDMSNIPNNIRFGLQSYQSNGTRVDTLQSLRNEVLVGARLEAA